jgi:hypothetical protein
MAGAASTMGVECRRGCPSRRRSCRPCLPPSLAALACRRRLPQPPTPPPAALDACRPCLPPPGMPLHVRRKLMYPPAALACRPCLPLLLRHFFRSRLRGCRIPCLRCRRRCLPCLFRCLPCLFRCRAPLPGCCLVEVLVGPVNPQEVPVANQIMQEVGGDVGALHTEESGPTGFSMAAMYVRVYDRT